MRFLSTQWQEVHRILSEVDYTFLTLQVLCLLGGAVLLATVSLPPFEQSILGMALAAFTVYSAACYLIIFLRPGSLRQVYFVSLFLDLIFLTCLVHFQAYLGNSLFIGFYLLVCLHTIYFGLRFGLLVATLTASLHLLSLTFKTGHIEWTETALRLAFLYLLAVPVGLLSDPCWEFLKCGIETDAARRCGAFPYFGRICWATAGSFDPGGIEGICAQKIENCQECSFYKIVNASPPLYTGGQQPG